jgi:hypothetical protein
MKKLIKYAVIAIVFVVSAISIFHLIQSNKLDEHTVD